MIGNDLEQQGWRQGSLIQDIDALELSAILGIQFDDSCFFIIASQSCDIANNQIEADPFIELSLARGISKQNGNLTHNKNPRLLHTNVLHRSADIDIAQELHIELKAFEKFQLPKEALLGRNPDPECFFSDDLLRSYVEWLSARYSRPALPTAFNDRIRNADNKNKLRDKAKKASISLTGIYVSIFPDTEIGHDDTYNVQLLGLLPANFQGDRTSANSAMQTYEGILKEAGMNVTTSLQTEDQISIAVMRRFKRFYLDDLSFKDDSTLPVEVATII